MGLQPAERGTAATPSAVAPIEKRAECLELTRLDPYPGTWIQGVGEYLENGKAKTASGHGGEPMLKVEIRALDVYDPTTGELRSSSTDDIAAWFLDTDHDGDALFVRHAYFTGADDPYDKLRRALRADISDDAWATVHSTVSRPFPRPRSGKIAIKVINQYGDEVLKVVVA